MQTPFVKNSLFVRSSRLGNCCDRINEPGNNTGVFSPNRSLLEGYIMLITESRYEKKFLELVYIWIDSLGLATCMVLKGL